MAKEKSISDTIKAAKEAGAFEDTKETTPEESTQEPEGTEPEGNQQTETAPTEEGQDMAASKWGNFKVETGIVPQRESGGSSKYDWASFPKPSNPDDSSTWTSVFIPGIGGKTIYTSIRKYRQKLQDQGSKDIPEFTVSVSKEPKGVRVIRKK